MKRRRWTSLIIACSAISTMSLGCDPYDGWGDLDGEFYAGPLDILNFPSAYLGADGNRFQQGAGIFVANRVTAGTQSATHVVFPFLPSQLANVNGTELKDELRYSAAYGNKLAYVFDPRAETPLAAQSNCQVAEGYSFDLNRDYVRFDEQGTVFGAVPNVNYQPGTSTGSDPAGTNNFAPIFQQVAVTTNGMPCQAAKSVDNLLVRKDVSFEKTELPNGKEAAVSNGRLMAMAIIDPGAAVHRFDSPALAPGAPTTLENSGIGIQKWGWFDHYLLSYIDGGYIEIADGTFTVPGDPLLGVPDRNVAVRRMVAQPLWRPRSQIVTQELNAAGDEVDYPVDAPGSTAETVGTGTDFDVVQFRRGEAGYSPICQVFTYDIGSPVAPDAVPMDRAFIEANYGATLQPAGYVYCFQQE